MTKKISFVPNLCCELIAPISPGIWVFDLHDDLHQPGPVGPADLPPH